MIKNFLRQTGKKIFYYLRYNLSKIRIDLKSNISIRGNIGFGTEIVQSNIYVNSVGTRCKLYKCVCMGNISIGDYVCIFGSGTILSSVKSRITIGNFTAIGQNVSIQDSDHRLDRASIYFMSRDMFGGDVSLDMSTKGDIKIGEDVWVGSNSVILSGVTIGRGAVIAAGSIVTKDVDQYTIVGGNPARFLKKRFSDKIIDELEKSQWWSWNHKKIMDNRDFFLKSRK